MSVLIILRLINRYPVFDPKKITKASVCKKENLMKTQIKTEKNKKLTIGRKKKIQ